MRWWGGRARWSNPCAGWRAALGRWGRRGGPSGAAGGRQRRHDHVVVVHRALPRAAGVRGERDAATLARLARIFLVDQQRLVDVDAVALAARLDPDVVPHAVPVLHIGLA